MGDDGDCCWCGAANIVRGEKGEDEERKKHMKKGESNFLFLLKKCIEIVLIIIYL